MHPAQFSDSTVNAECLELCEVLNSGSNETTDQCPAVPDLDTGSGTAVPDPLQAISSRSAATHVPDGETVKKLKPMKGKGQPQKQKVTIDDINEMHLAVLQKENVKLDLEIENLLFKKREIMLRIQELEAKKNNSPDLIFFSC